MAAGAGAEVDALADAAPPAMEPTTTLLEMPPENAMGTSDTGTAPELLASAETCVVPGHQVRYCQVGTESSTKVQLHNYSELHAYWTPVFFLPKIVVV